MTVSVTMIGKLAMPKETENFKPYFEQTYNSGWVNKGLFFNVLSENSRFSFRIRGGRFSEKSGRKSKVYYQEPGKRENGKFISGERKSVDWDLRDTVDVSKVAEFSKFIIDLEEPSYRYKLRAAVKTLEDGNLLDDSQIALFKTDSLKDLREMLKKSESKRKEFIWEGDFADYIFKVVNHDNFKNRKFKIRGTYEMEYDTKNSKWYANYVPNRIYLESDEVADDAQASVDLFYSSDSLVLDEETSKYNVNGFVWVYSGDKKENIPAPYTVTFLKAPDDADDLAKKKEAVLKKRFSATGDEVFEYGVICKLINGSEAVSITYDDLDDEQKENIDLGLLTLEEIQAAEGNVYGDRIEENRFLKPSKNFSKGRQETTYVKSDLVLSFDEPEAAASTDEDDDYDLFGDDDGLFD